MNEREYIINLLFELIDDGNINEIKLKRFYEENKIINKSEYEKSINYYYKKRGNKEC